MPNFTDTLNQIMLDGTSKDLVHKFADKSQNTSSLITVDGSTMVNLGSCSYLGLEHHEALKLAGQQAIQKFGTQFSSSRTYLSHGLYEELEHELFSIFQRPLIATASTTLGHLAALPVLVQEGDAVIIDLQAHSSMQMTAQLLKARNIPLHLIPHNNLDVLEHKIKSLRNKYRKIWFLADGVYSMYGDLAPFKQITNLLNTYRQLHLYIDDAHGMSWTGNKGCGVVHSNMPHHERMYMLTSLNKSFAAAGGAIIFPSEADKTKVLNCGATLTFCGPIQPGMLGVAVKSAQLHQSSEILGLQENFSNKINYVNNKLKENGIPQFAECHTPIFFIPAGLPKITYDIIASMKAKGFFLNSAAFPAVPMKRSGIRFMANACLSFNQIDSMVLALKETYFEALEQHQSSLEDICQQFKLSSINQINTVSKPPKGINTLTTKSWTSINDIPQQQWNETLGQVGCLSTSNLALLEQAFQGNGLPEENAEFHYVKISDAKNKVLLFALVTVSLLKDDMLADSNVSKSIEETRKEQPYYLTSKQIISGTLFSLGNALHMNFDDPRKKEILATFVKWTEELSERVGAKNTLIRGFNESDSEKLSKDLLGLGMTKYSLPSNCIVENLDWSGTEEYLSLFKRRYRYDFKKEILGFEDRFTINFEKPTGELEKSQCIALYENVFEKSFEINVFKLPNKLFSLLFKDPNYDFIRLYLKEAPTEPVAVLFSYINGSVYNALAVGLDYRYVKSHNTYKQVLYQSVKRASQLSCTKLDLAYTAEMVKKKIGAKVENQYAFVQMDDLLNSAIISMTT